MIIPFFLPYAGCPSRCSFCNSRELNQRDDREINRTAFDAHVSHHLKRAPVGQKVQVAFYGGCFSLIETDQQIRLLEWANHWIRKAYVDSIRFSTLPIPVSDHMIDYYRQVGVQVIEMGVEILDNAILTINERHLTVDQIHTAFCTFHQAGFRLGIHLMSGLPGADWRQERASLIRCLGLPFDFARIHPTVVLKRTLLEQMYLQKAYEPLSLREAVYRSAFFAKAIRIVHGKTIAQTGVFIDPLSASIVVAGPYHSAFGDLVRIKMRIDKTVETIDREGIIFLKKEEVESFFAHHGFFVDDVSEMQFRQINRNQIEVRKR